MLRKISPDFTHKNILAISTVGILVASKLVYAQQPVAELGGWPPGAFTLLVGIWLASRIGLQRNYDTSFPPCTRAGLHRIPWIKRLLWAREPLGQSLTCLVLSSLQCPEWQPALRQFTTDDGAGVLEWDILTVYQVNQCPAVYFTEVVGTTESGDSKYELKINAPRLCSLEVVVTFTTKAGIAIDDTTSILFESLFHSQYMSPQCADDFLLCWRGLQNFLVTGTLNQAGGDVYDSRLIWDAFNQYRSKPEEVIDWPEARVKLRVYIENPTDTSEEAAPGSTLIDDVFHAGQLVTLLIYVESFPETIGVNPLIPLLLNWSQGGLKPTDNFLFNLRSFKKISMPPPREGPEMPSSSRDSTPKPNARYEINLSERPVIIDGGGYLASQKYAWFWSTVAGAIITFFASLVGSSNPSFATAIGLSLLRPYSNDDNFEDAGSPLTWGGRRRIRWGQGRACGIFSGMTQLRLGKTGNSLNRGCILLFTSWITWYWRSDLRNILSFQPAVPAATWVKWVAVGLEAHSALWMFLGAYFYSYRRVYSVVVVNIIAGTHVVVVTVLMIFSLRTGKGVDILFYVSESFTITGCMITGQTFVGVGSEHVYVHHAVTLYWSHIIASSCFSYLR